MALTQVPIELSSTPGIVDNSNATAITIDSSENVGIGRAPRVMLDVAGEAAIAYNATYGLRFYNQDQNNWSFIGNDVTTSAADLRFGDSTGEVMRLSGGNVGIGTSSITSVSGYTALEINNATNGAILDLSQGDSMRGRLIATASSMALETSGSIPIIFQPAGTERMRILSTGGITFNGDTAQANALDDYEEGTWTMGLNTSNSDLSASITNTTGTYTKVGNIVNVRIYTGGVNVTAAGSGTAQITGLPFTVSNSGNANSNYSAASFAHTNIFSTTYESYAAIGQNYAVVTQVGSVTSAAFATGSLKYMMFTLTYKTDA
jgi:hypothetical protein